MQQRHRMITDKNPRRKKTRPIVTCVVHVEVGAMIESAALRKTKQAVRALLPQGVLNWREARYYCKYGEIEMRLVDLLCRSGEDAIDVGANFGGYVHFMQHHARRVIAFEPVPEFVCVLRGKF